MPDFIYSEVVGFQPVESMGSRAPIRLSPGLRDPNPVNRIEEIVHTDKPRAMLWWMAENDKDPKVCLAALKRMQELGEVAGNIIWNIAKTHRDADVRVAAVNMTRAPHILKEIAKTDRDPKVRSAAIAALPDVNRALSNLMESISKEHGERGGHDEGPELIEMESVSGTLGAFGDGDWGNRSSDSGQSFVGGAPSLSGNSAPLLGAWIDQIIRDAESKRQDPEGPADMGRS